jgi:acyl carrier protein
MSNSIEQKVIEVVKEVTREPNIDINSTDQNVTDWDSMAYLVIASKIEDFFGVEVSINNIERFNSVSSIINLIRSGDKDPNV